VVSEIFGEAFRDKFTRLSGIAPERITMLLGESGILHDHPFPGYLVAELDDRVVGVMMLKWRGQKRTPPAPVTKGSTSWWERRRLRAGLMILDHAPKEGECYVEYVAVASTARGMGVGTDLIREGMTIATNTGLRRFTLYVAGGNQEAIRVYEKAGMRMIRNVRSRLTDRFFAVREWHFNEAHLE